MNKNVAAIIAKFEESLKDNLFSRSERRDIEEYIKENDPNIRDLALLRSRIFDIAKEKSTEDNLSWIIDWLEVANKALLSGNQSTQSSYSKAFFSPGEDCRQAILNFITSAKSSLKICVFTISDNTIRDAILSQHAHRISIQIITDNDKCNDMGSDIYSMHRKGVSVKVDNTSNHMHHKFAIRDNQELLTGSFNWTRSATQYNNENILLTNDLKVLNQYNEHFKKLWKEMVPLT